MNRRTYPSGLQAVDWTGQCPRCGATQTVPLERLAHAWEVAHARNGCGRALRVDETGRGWIVAMPTVPR